MKLAELFEALTASVYKDKDLIVISDLVQDAFDVSFSGDVDGICLMVQTIYTMAAVSKIPAQDIVDSFKGDIPWKGLTLAEIYKHFAKTKIKSNGKFYKFKLSLEEYTTIESLIRALENGQPTTMIIKAFGEFRNAIDDAENTKDGKARIAKTLDRASLKGSSAFHALLLIGYDKKEKFLIGRETSAKYSFKGYFKLSAKHLKPHFNEIGKYFGIVVDSVTEVKG